MSSKFLRRSSTVKSPLPLEQDQSTSPKVVATTKLSRSRASVEPQSHRVQVTAASSNVSAAVRDSKELEDLKQEMIKKDEALEESLLDKDMAQASVELLEVENQTLAIKVQELEAKLEWTRNNLVKGMSTVGVCI